jgi:hypothetical protein
MPHWKFTGDPIDHHDILMTEYLVRVAQHSMHPVFRPFVAVTCWGLRRAAERWPDHG